MPEVIQLPIVKMQGKRFFVDERLKELRNVENPHDKVPFDEAFVRIRVDGDYIVLNDPDMIRQAKAALFEDVSNAHKFGEFNDWLISEPAPDGHLNQIPEFLLEEREED